MNEEIVTPRDDEDGDVEELRERENYESVGTEPIGFWELGIASDDKFKKK